MAVALTPDRRIKRNHDQSVIRLTMTCCGASCICAPRVAVSLARMIERVHRCAGC